MRYFFWFWPKVIRLALYVIRTRAKETRWAYAQLDDLEARFGGHFQPATKYKIAVSYGIYTPMVCDAFTRLRGRKTDREERRRYLLYFICSSLFDDFTDYSLISPEQLHAISFQPDIYQPSSFDEKLFLFAHQTLKQAVRHREAYEEVSRQLFEAQEQSRAQANGNLDEATIRQITFAKGGYSVLLCNYYLKTDGTPDEKRCWYQIGTLIQLTNDLYDIHKDMQEGFTTLTTRMRDAYSFEAFFIGEINSMKTQIRQMAYPPSQLKVFSLCMAGIYAFGLIALAQLKRIQGQASSLPEMATIPRKALIIDMEKPANLIRWFKYTYRYARLK
jgi:hypothetical protein